ncbi:MAG: AMP-binding protein [Methylococcales bacterium]
MLKKILHRLLTLLYRVEVKGLKNYDKAGKRVLIVANHTSFLDPLLLGVFLPTDIMFAINTYIAEKFWIKPFLALARIFPMDPTNPLSSKALIHHLSQDNKAVIFPEGRITVTGSLMKIYDGTGMIADRSNATILPIRIDGAQYSPFSRLRGRVRLRWFPKITLNILPPTKISGLEGIKGRERRKKAGRQLSDLMTQVIFATGDYHKTLFAAILDARHTHGGKQIVLDDIQRKPWNYNKLIAQACGLATQFDKTIPSSTTVGILLPNSATTVATLFALQISGRIPALLNYSAGSTSLESACRTADIVTVLCSRRFLQMAKLESIVEALESKVNIVYLEDIAKRISVFEKLIAFLQGLTADYWYWRKSQQPTDPAITLFTSGSEGSPKGVLLSHINLLSNREQMASRIDFGAQDIILNALPLFHSFGLTAGTLLPLTSGMRTFLYPSPLHYRVIPEVAYEINATILFGTNTFLAGYANTAHPYDFYSVRYVFAGAEKLQDETRRLWANKFGIRIFEGYGATEASPVLATNTAMEFREGTVGRFLPGIDYRLEGIPGVKRGKKLHVTGPNLMLGYYLPENPGVRVPPQSKFGPGWYDTGDLVEIDTDGFISICGRVKRFAKIAGEMVSLAAAEELAANVWPEALHAVVALPDPKKGEQLVLVTDHPSANRAEMLKNVSGASEINIPRTILNSKSIPLMATGKIDYPAVTQLAMKEQVS